MRILLPPSEAKHAGGTFPAARSPTGATALPDASPTAPPELLGAPRERVAKALIAFAGTRRAAVALALPSGTAAEDLAANRAILTTARMPAIERYAGTVYQGLDIASLGRAARARGDDSVLIFSGLWGVLRATEQVPAYRLPAATALPRLGVLATFWRPVLDAAMPVLVDDGLVVDLRSTDYSAMWRPRGELAERVVRVRVLSQRPGLPPRVVSYPSKLAKGQLARALLSRRARVRTVAHVVDAWRGTGGSGAIQHDVSALDLLI